MQQRPSLRRPLPLPSVGASTAISPGASTTSTIHPINRSASPSGGFAASTSSTIWPRGQPSAMSASATSPGTSLTTLPSESALPSQALQSGVKPAARPANGKATLAGGLLGAGTAAKVTVVPPNASASSDAGSKTMSSPASSLPPPTGSLGGMLGINLGKAKPGVPKYVSSGILGIVKQRLSSIFDSVPGKYNVLVCDQLGAKVVSACLRMHELMEHGITIVEDIFMPRQPLINSSAIYFINPEERIAEFIVKDFETRSTYKDAYIFFTHIAPGFVIEQLAGCPRLVDHIQTVQDTLLDFSAAEPLFFHLDMQKELPKLFPPETALRAENSDGDGILGEITEQLVAVMYSLGAGVPMVRYQARSMLAERVASTFAGVMKKVARELQGLNANSESQEPPLLIVVDRSYDSVEPLIHERTYQALLEDLTPLADGVYNQEYTDRSGEKRTRQCPIGETDPYWCVYRHQFMPTCLEELPRMLQQLLEQNPALANGMKKDGGATLTELGGAVRALPEFQEKQSKLSLHIDMCTRVMAEYKAQRLMSVCEVEQLMVTAAAGKLPFKDLLKEVEGVITDASYPFNVRLRLLLTFLASSNTREFTDAKKQQLMEASGLAKEQARCARLLDCFSSHMGRLPQPLASSAVTTAPAGAARGYVNQAFLVLDAAARNALSLADFPVVSGSEAPVQTLRTDPLGGASTADGPRGGGKRTLKAGFNRLHNNGDGAASNGSSTSTQQLAGDGMLDLGYEAQVPLRSRRKVVLFIIGGVTYGETRSAYEAASQHGREMIIGSTSVLRPTEFIEALNTIKS